MLLIHFLPSHTLALGLGFRGGGCECHGKGVHGGGVRLFDYIKILTPCLIPLLDATY